MAAEFGLVIRGGTIVDGTGCAPIDADLGIKDGRIAAIGPVAKNGAEEIGAKGKLVTPGFGTFTPTTTARRCGTAT